MQGRFKRDGSASAEPEPHGGTGPINGSSAPQHAQNPGPAAPSGDGGDRSGRPGTASSGPTAPAAPTIKPPTGAKAPQGPGSRLALRNWRISTRLVSLLALPVVAATSLGALRIGQNIEDIRQLENMKLLTDMTKQATALADALQAERDQSAGPLAHGSSATDYTIKALRDKTDRAREDFINASEEIDDSNSDTLQGVRENLVLLVHNLSDLEQLRNTAFDSKGNYTQTVEAYHRLITQLLNLSQDMAQATSNPEMIQRTRALAAFSAAKEYASVQRAVLAAALPPNKEEFGELSQNDRLYGQSAFENEEAETKSFIAIYGKEAGADELLEPIDDTNATIAAAETYASRALRSADGLENLDKRSYKDWIDDSSTKIDQMGKIEQTLLDEMEQKARELRNESEQEAIFSGVLILLVLGISLVGAFVVARSMIRSLRRLEETATKVATERLPELVKQLSESDPQDVDTSVESVGVHSRDEIGKVAAAFDDVHREAVRLAAEQALLRGNVNAMFTNLSRRSQGLIQRQLSLISELESREADPDQLSSLFKLDHLATRMRRNGENLLVLAGEEPGRRWTRPVPLVDVLRAAASEVEQYERIELAAVPSTEVAGRVVNDLVHLLAELLENATSFSSPQTKVKVTGHALPDGRVLIEIHDTGIGLSPEDLAAINERLASPPTVDVSVSRRMGLFVVGRLSQRHGIRIQLRPSDSGGTTALVMLPVDVAQGGKKPQAGKPTQGGAPAAAAAAAGAAAARRAVAQGQAGGARAALPGAGNRPGGPGAMPGGPRGPQSPAAPQRPAPAGAGAGFGGQAPSAPQGFQGAQQDMFGANRTPAPPQQPPTVGSGAGDDQQQGRRRGRQLTGRGNARPELPGTGQQQRPSWSDENAQPQVSRGAMDSPRSHDDQDPAQTSRMPRIDDRQGPSTGQMPAVSRFDNRQDTGQFARPDLQAPPPPRHSPQDTGQFARPDFASPQQTGQFPQPDLSSPSGTGSFVRPDVFGAPAQNDPSSTGQFPAVPSYDASSTGQFPAVQDGAGTGQHSLPARQDPSSTGQFERPQAGGRGPADYNGSRPAVPQRPQRPLRQEPEALPPAPAGSGNERTPLYDTLETNWFRGKRVRQDEQQSSAPAEPTPQAPAPSSPRSSASVGWRSSPNDELVKQAERVRQPAAGGVTTSGLPRRVPRANLVPGTAAAQPHQSGPSVSRAPDDVRGRLTNLRRGIAQGRQAGHGQTGSFPSPTHQQER